MPYIKDTQRQIVDKEIDTLSKIVHDLPPQERGGILNYIFSVLLVEAFGRVGYFDTSQAIGTLECCKQEWYRRVMGPYEDTKVVENGDVYER